MSITWFGMKLTEKGTLMVHKTRVTYDVVRSMALGRLLRTSFLYTYARNDVGLLEY